MTPCFEHHAEFILLLVVCVDCIVGLAELSFSSAAHKDRYRYRGGDYFSERYAEPYRIVAEYEGQ